MKWKAGFGSVAMVLVILSISVMAFVPISPGSTAPKQSGPEGITERDYWPTDGWQSTSPEDQDMDSAQLDALYAEIETNFPGIESLLIVRHGYLVGETYFGAYTGEEPCDLRSATKSFVSALVGLAIDRGDLDGVEARLIDYFPQYFDAYVDPRTGDITVDDLLTMRSGLLWTEGGRTTEYIMRSSNYLEAIVHLPQILEPGQGWNYSSADANLLMGIVQEATETEANEFANDYLFEPLGITDYRWMTDPQGYPLGGSGLFLTPGDMAKFGFLYLNQGCWDGEQLFSAEWVADTMTPHVELDGANYGYLWWLAEVDGYDLYMALGYGGQRLYVLPGLDLVVVITSNFSDPDALNRLAVLQDYVIPSLLDVDTRGHR